MSLNIGDKAPQFELLNQDGVKIALKDFIGKKVILYFYPKDNTPGCTTEACDFSANYDKFGGKNAVIIGISPDSVASHEKFISKFDLKHILLSDSEKKLLKLMELWGLRKITEKNTKVLFVLLLLSMKQVRLLKFIVMFV